MTSDWVINCAGLNSDSVNINKNKHPGIYYSKGSYFKLSTRWRNKFKHLVYPVPDKKNKSLGVHLTIDKNGYVRLGPNAQKLSKKKKRIFMLMINKNFFL